MNIQGFAQKIIQILASRWFFYGVIALFVLQALWFVFSAQYPMAFDEDFHFRFIQVYAQQLSPFIPEPPEDTGPLGALTREPSYLFAYLMSFPYRLIAVFTQTPEVQIIILRLLNVALFTFGLVLFRRLLLRVTASTALTHFTLLMFTLIPIVPFLAAHINYDNLLFPLIPITLLLALSCADGMKRGTFPLKETLLLLIVCLIASIVKFPFLPILLGVALYYFIILLWRKKPEVIALLKTIPKQFRAISLPLKIALGAGIVIASFLFIERYGVNYVQYGSLVPKCGDVLPFEHCSQYGPWIRNYHMAIENAPLPLSVNPFLYLLDWFDGMMHRLFFAINHEYYTRNELPIPIAVAYGVAIAGIVAFLASFREVFRRYPALILFFIVSLVYTVTMAAQNYSLLVNLGDLVAVNGRYFIPIFPIMFAIVAISIKVLLDKLRYASVIKVALASGVLLLFLQGGGVTTFILRSDASWYWQNESVIRVNDATRSVLSPLIYEGDPEVPIRIYRQDFGN